MEAVSASETLLPTYQTAHFHNPQDRNMNLEGRENLENDTQLARSKKRNIEGKKQWD
jgi:hypothetical protein